MEWNACSRVADGRIRGDDKWRSAVVAHFHDHQYFSALVVMGG